MPAAVTGLRRLTLESLDEMDAQGDVLGEFTALTRLDIYRSLVQYTTLPRSLQHFHLNLYQLEFEFDPDDLMSIAQALPGCSQLTHLALNKWLAPFPSNLHSLTALQRLELNSFWSDFGDSLSCFADFAATLTRLDLKDCPNSQLLSHVGQLTSLKRLNLAEYCGMPGGFDYLRNLDRLTYLSLANSFDSSVPFEPLPPLRHLLHLNLSCCHFSKLPEGLTRITSLCTLNVSGIPNLRLECHELEGLRLHALDLTGCGFQFADSQWMFRHARRIRGLV